MRILITGANGQLGKALRIVYPDAITVDSAELDITDVSQLGAFDWSTIDTVINAAAYTNVDGAQTPEGRTVCWNVNAQGVANLARVAAEHSLTLVHVSSEYVFDGTINPHKEDELFSPLSVYGASKAAGDVATTLVPKHYLVRTSWVVGEGNNFVKVMLGLADKGISPSVVADQIGRLTFTNTLAASIVHLLKENAPYGTYNVSNDGTPASWAAIARKIFEMYNHPEIMVTDTTTEEYFANKPQAAPRPLSSMLDISKIKNTGFIPESWETLLPQYIKEIST